MFRFKGPVLAMALCSTFVCATTCAGEPAHASFQSELSSILDIAKSSKRVVMINAGSATFAGEVVQIMPDAVLLKSQQDYTYLIRVDRIDAIAWQAPSSANVSK